MKKFNLLYKPINLMKFPDLKKKMLKYEKISHKNLKKFNNFNDEILDNYYKFLENSENNNEINNSKQANEQITEENESNYDDDDLFLPFLKYRKKQKNDQNKSSSLLKNTFDKINNEKQNRRTLFNFNNNKFKIDKINNNISEISQRKSFKIKNPYNFDNNILNYKKNISKTNKININNNLSLSNKNNNDTTNKTMNITNYISKDNFYNQTRSSKNSENKKTKKNSNKYILFLKQYDNEDENQSENEDNENNSNNNITKHPNYSFNNSFNNYYKTTINNLCKKINNNCNKMNKEINNKPKFKFVTENEIKNEVTKKDLELNKNKKEHNGFKNMRIFSETKAISKISYNLSYKANKFILNNLEKKKKKKYNFNFKESTDDYNKTRKKFFKKAFELLENSKIEKMKCMKI